MTRFQQHKISIILHKYHIFKNTCNSYLKIQDKLILLQYLIFSKYFKQIITILEMQSKKYVNNPQTPVFNIRKVNKKVSIPGKNIADFNYESYQTMQSSQIDVHHYSNANRVFDSRKQKQMMLDQSVNQAIVNSKVYGDLKKIYLDNKKRNVQNKKALEERLSARKQQKKVALQEKQRLESEKQKYLQTINAMKQKLQAIRQTNQRYRQALSNRVSGQAEYISNLIMSMRFQAEYQHDIDPDKMTYEELLELGDKIGVVSKGLPIEVIQNLPKVQIKQASQDRCTVCFSNYQIGEVMTKIPNCKHQFHYQCLQSWLGKQKVCPICKQQVLFDS